MYLLFDIGGTNMRLAVSKDGKGFGEPVIVPTPQNFSSGIGEIARIAKELSGGEAITNGAGGIAGPLDRQRAMLVNAPHLSDWAKKPLKAELEKALTAPVHIENDAAMVGLGEAVYGAGKGHGIVVYITVSTGIGGARIVNGRIDSSAYGFEPGHQIIQFDSAITCPGCGGAGHLEGFTSGTAVERKYGKKPHDVTDEAVWDEVAKYLAIGLNNTIVHWSPDAVVMGGSMMIKKPGVDINRVREYIDKTLTIFPNKPELKLAELGHVGGLWGALAYLNSKM
ncbi:MAG: ROK family protein [bacterium]|nr:ROK family protein [bacterium]